MQRELTSQEAKFLIELLWEALHAAVRDRFSPETEEPLTKLLFQTLAVVEKLHKINYTEINSVPREIEYLLQQFKLRRGNIE